MQQQLAVSKRLLEVIYASASVGLALVDADLRFLMVNATQATMNGLTISATGEAVRDRQISGTTPAEPEVERHWLATYYPVNLGDGQRGVGMVATEISELIATKQALRGSEARFQAFMRHAPSLNWIVSAEGRLLHANPAYQYLLQRLLPEAIGCHLSELFSPEDAARYLNID